MNLNLQGKKVLITGGSKGIGRSCAEVLASEGCVVHIAARGKETLLEVKKSIESKCKTSVEIHAVDLSKGDEARGLVDACSDIDILVNNAGAIPGGDLWEIDESRWREAWDLKVFGYINLCRAVFPKMKARKKGVIINVIGAAGERPRFNYITGGTGNAALMAFTRGLGARSLKVGIRVVAINPGLIVTERLEKLMRTTAKNQVKDPERWQEFLPKDPPPGDPIDIANAVAFLASDCAKNITGTVVTIDGGSSWA